MIKLAENTEPKKYGFVYLDYGGGTWTNGRIHFFRGSLSPIGDPNREDLDTLLQMQHEGTIIRTKEETA
ncbi:MAG: hypothetical protein A2Y16_05495 [Tenericutes bacterium GWF2_57_13]|nr:MAG: hypothetical protein A2Y16_05495 [Tenericutes bacterium GWF2_57_13]